MSGCIKRKLAFPALALATLALAPALTGCASPLTVPMAKVTNFGTDLDDDEVDRHLLGMVAFNEQFPGQMSMYWRNHMYLQGVTPESPMYYQRVVGVNSGHLKGMLWHPDNTLRWSTPAMVPEHLERLRAGDVVEFRQHTGYLALANWPSTGEGNIIVKVLCRKADSSYQACMDALPKVGKSMGGEMHDVPYHASVKDYGFKFGTTYYDKVGKQLLPIPEYAPKN